MTLRMSYAGEVAEAVYSLALANDSATPYTFYVFQTLPDQSPNVFSLAWFASPFIIVPGNRLRFQWSIDYNCVWAATRTLRPGVGFYVAGRVDVDPGGANTTTFTMEPGPHLTGPVSEAPKGSLVIADEGTVPGNEFSVGIGLSGAGTFAVQAGPNLTHTFSPAPTPTYWIGAGSHIQVGDVLEVTTGDPVEEVSFPPNVYDLSYTLNTSNKWELQDN